MDVEVTVCDICGDAGQEKLLAVCNHCNDGAEHIYCMHVKLNKVPEGDWMCEECRMRSERQRSESSASFEPWNSSKLKQTEGVNPAKRQRVPPKAQSMSKGRVIGMRAELGDLSRPSWESPFKRLREAESEPARGVSSVKQSSHGSTKKSKFLKLGAKAKIAHDICSSLKSRSSKTADLKFKQQLAKGGGLQKRKVERNLAFDDIRKEENLKLVSKSVSIDSISSKKLNATCPEAILANAGYPVVFKNSSSAEETIAGSRSSRLDAVQICGESDCRLQPNSCSAHEDLNCPNEENKNESQQAKQLIEAATASLSEKFVTPNPDYIWQGEFQLHSIGTIASVRFGIQAHSSTYALQEILEVADRFPEIVVLEELPRLMMWPSQFIENQATEEIIDLYFFAKDRFCYGTYYRRLMEYMTMYDLALRGNFDGVELLIFPSNVLPEKYQRWNKSLFLWGYMQVSSSQKLGTRDIVSSLVFDPNAYPEDGNCLVRTDEVGKFGSIIGSYSQNRILIGGYSYNVGCSDLRRSHDGGEKRSEYVVPYVDLSLKNATPEHGSWLSVVNVVDETNKDVRGKQPMVEENDADGVVSPTLYGEDIEMLHWLAAVTLFSLSRGLTKI